MLKQPNLIDSRRMQPCGGCAKLSVAERRRLAMPGRIVAGVAVEGLFAEDHVRVPSAGGVVAMSDLFSQVNGGGIEPNAAVEVGKSRKGTPGI